MAQKSLQDQPSSAMQEPPEEMEQACSYCPRCSERLEPRQCKLICTACGYYMSCSDFY